MADAFKVQDTSDEPDTFYDGEADQFLLRERASNAVAESCMIYHAERYEQRADGFYVHGRMYTPSQFGDHGYLLEAALPDEAPNDLPMVGPILTYDGGQLIAPEDLKIPDAPVQYRVVVGVLQRKGLQAVNWEVQNPIFVVTPQGAFFFTREISAFNLFSIFVRSNLRDD